MSSNNSTTLTFVSSKTRVIAAVLSLLLVFSMVVTSNAFAEDELETTGELSSNQQVEGTEPSDGVNDENAGESDFADEGEIEDTDSVDGSINPEVSLLSGTDEEISTLGNATVDITQLTSSAQIQAALASALTTTSSGDTITVTGTAANLATTSIAITIPEGVTVLWSGNITAASSMYFINPLILLTGTGTFKVADGSLTGVNNPAIKTTSDVTVEVAEGGVVTSASTTVWCAEAGNPILKVTGGTISTTGDANRSAISITSGTVNNGTFIMTGGLVKAGLGPCFETSAGESTLTVQISGGVVENAATKSDKTTIYEASARDTSQSSITISGTAIIRNTAQNAGSTNIIRTFGNVTIAENAKLEAVSSGGILVQGSDNTVTLSGGSIIVDNAPAVACQASSSEVNISNIEISSMHTGIQLSGANSELNMEGGVIAAKQGGTALYTAGAGPTTLNVSGGEISSETGNAIWAFPGNASVAISGGTISATTGNAVKFNNAGATLSVSGGTLFAYGSDIVGSSNVLNLADSSSFTGPTGDGVLIAWNKNAGNTSYDADSTTDITILPATGATVGWAKGATSSDLDGIGYSKGNNSGFIGLENVAVKKMPTVADFDYSIPTDHVYDGLGKSIGTIVGADDFDETTGGEITVYYEGVDPTVFAKTTDLPVNVGTYKVTIDTAGGSSYSAASNIELGNMEIAKANQDAPAAFELGYTYDKTAKKYTVEIPEFTGAEYSFDGVSFGTTRITEAAVGDVVTGYVRYPADDNHNESLVTSASTTMPPYLSVRTVTDPSSGASVTGLMAADAVVVLDQEMHAEGDCEVCDYIRGRDAAGELLAFHNISLEGDYEGALEISIQVGAEHEGKTLRVIHCENCSFDDRSIKVVDGKVTDTYNSLSPFGVIDTSTPNPDPKPNPPTPIQGGGKKDPGSTVKTGDIMGTTVTLPLITLAGFSVGIMIVASILLRRQRTKQNEKH